MGDRSIHHTLNRKQDPWEILLGRKHGSLYTKKKMREGENIGKFNTGGGVTGGGGGVDGVKNLYLSWLAENLRKGGPRRGRTEG